jgi:predicted nucleic acid-binding protein
MIYFDTDVLVNYCTEQETAKHIQAVQLVDQAIADGVFLISVLSINELSFVLAKLKIDRSKIANHLEEFCLTNPVAITVDHAKRAAQIAYKVSFHHSSDCLHTAIAEEYCSELYTYNHSDFQLIEHHTKLKISIF